MLDLFLDTERTARKLKGWRGPMMMLAGFGVGGLGLVVAYIQSILVGMTGAQQVANTPLDYLSFGILALGFAAVLYGLWVYYKDTMYQAWRVEAGDHWHW